MSLPFLPGWYVDPSDSQRQRFWSGDLWTAKTRTSPLPGSGWYPALHAGFVRFWDGDGWTDSYEPNPRDQGTPPPTRPGSTPSDADGMLCVVANTGVDHSIPRPTGARWYAPSETVEVAGLAIDGMLYVGDRLPSITAWGRDDPALIIPGLPVIFGEISEPLGHAPSYRSLSRRQRGRYLEWLAAGRPAVDEIGYAFLFYYGLERRVLVDNPPIAERRQIIHTVARLLMVNEHPSFTKYARRLMHYLSWTSQPELRDRPPEDEHFRSWTLDVQLGLRADAGLPLTEEWAFAWYRAEGSAVAATVYPEEFRAAFSDCFDRRFPGGMTLIPSTRSLRLTYSPASAHLTETAFVLETTVPRLRARDKAVAALNETAAEANQSLKPFVRRRSKTAPAPPSIAEMALLPPAVLQRIELSPVAEVRDWVASLPQRSIIARNQLERYLDVELSKTVATAAERLLERLDVAIVGEGEIFALGRTGPGDPPSEAQSTSLAAVGFVLGVPELVRLDTLADAANGKARDVLRAHALLLSTVPPRKALIGRRVARLDADGKAYVRSMLLANVNAGAGPSAIERLQYLYGRLGLDASTALGDLHRAAPASSTTSVHLDFERIRQTQTESSEVAHLLHDIFTDDSSGREMPDEPIPNDDTTGGRHLPSFDERTKEREFIEFVRHSEEWERGELEAWTIERGLMLDGTLELINDRALEKVDDVAFLVYNETVVVQTDVVNELYAQDPPS